MSDELTDLRKRVAFLEMAVLPFLIHDPRQMDPDLSLPEARGEVDRGLPAYQRRVVRDVKRRVRQRKPRLRFDGHNLAAVREFCGDLASLTVDHGVLWVVSGGQSAEVHQGWFLERNDEVRRIYVIPPTPQTEADFEEYDIAQIYKEANA